MTKKTRGLLIALSIFALVFMVTYPYTRPYLTVRDPESRWFRPENFRFENYPRSGDRYYQAGVDKMFPKGTPRAYVEKILVDRAGAWVSPGQNRTVAYHRRNNALFGWVVIVQYDTDEKVIEAWAH